MEQADDQAREIAELRDRLSRLSQASLRINESLDFDTVLQGVLDSACSLTGARYGVMAEEPVKPRGRKTQAPSLSLFEWAVEQEREEEPVGAGR